MFMRKLFLVSIIFLVALFVAGLILPLGKDEGQRGVLLPWNAPRESDVGAVDTLS